MAHTPNTNRSAARCSRRDQRTNYFMRCFNAMRANGLTFSARRASGVILPMIAAVLLLAAAAKVGHAQSDCPTLTGDCNTWTEVTVITSMDGHPLNGPDSALCGQEPPVSCCLLMNFCYECCHGVVETFLEKVEPISTACTSYTVQQMIDFADWYASYWAIYQYLGQGGACDITSYDCPTQYLEVESYTPGCWKLISNLTADYVYEQCSGTGYMCQTDFNVCWDPITHTLDTSNYTTFTSGIPTCTTPPDTGSWTMGTCYTINCPNGYGGEE
jgi:hypothetical protein